MKYLLDTNIIIDHIRQKEIIDENTLSSYAGISIITLGELIYGAYKANNPQKSLRLLENNLKTLKFEIVNLSEEIINEFGQIKAVLEIKGQKLEDFDLLIAATAMINNLVLITRNTKHFQRIQGLELAE